VLSPPEKGGPGGIKSSLIILSRKTTEDATDTVALVYDERKRSRLKVTLASGREAGIFLERGNALHGGDRLAAEDDHTVVEILAAPEKLIEAIASDPQLFARAAYHLGNRHVPVQIVAESGGGRLRFQTDHVLAEMVRGLGCPVSETEAPFQPEAGAYGGSHLHRDEAAEAHHPGHGAHRSVSKIHQFKPR
jgi:urease accessory protein